MKPIVWAAYTAACFPLFAQFGAPAPRSTPTLIDVRVRDTARAAVEGARVSVQMTGALDPAQRLPRYGATIPPKMTGSDGAALIRLPLEGYWRVAVHCDGYLDSDDPAAVDHIESLRVARGQTVRLDVTLVKAASFEGAVYLDDGRKLAQAVVHLQDTERAAGWLTERTGSAGQFEFPAVPPGQYGMWLAPPDDIVRQSLRQDSNGEWTGYAATLWHPSVEELRVILPVEIAPGADMRGYNAVLRKVRVYPVQGVLVDSQTHEPLTTARIGLRAEGEAAVSLLDPRPVTGDKAGFDFPALAAGEYSLMIYRDVPGGSLPWGVRISPGERRVDNLAIEVPEWVTVTGRVAAAANPVSAAGPVPSPRRGPVPAEALTIELQQLDSSSRPSIVAGSVELRGAGRTFESPPVPPGRYRLQLTAPEGWYVASCRLGMTDLLEKPELAADGGVHGIEVRVEQGGSALEGVVATAKGEAVPTGLVCAAASGEARQRQPGGTFCVRAGTDGVFRTPWLSPGAWHVWAFAAKPAERPGSPEFDAAYGGDVVNIDVPKDGNAGNVTLLVRPPVDH